jgi:hypothetical protein
MPKNIEHIITTQPFILNGCVNAEELPDFFLQKKKEWTKTPCGPKAEVERFLESGVGFFPDRLVILRSIVCADEVDTIEKKLYEGVINNYSMGIRVVADRPIFSGTKLNWDLEIDTNDKINNFLHNTLPRWQTDAALDNYRIVQLILMNNPPNAGTKVERPNQFVFRIRWDDFSSLNSLASQLLLEMVIGTNRLRELDRRMEDGSKNVIRYECLYKPTRFLEKTELQVGSSYLKDGPSKQENGNLTINGPLTQIKLDGVDETSAKTILAVLSQINNLITDPNVQFLKRLEFFAGLGLNIVEFQGYIDETGTRKMYIYGLRGNNDDTKTGLQPNK